jgi:hypothetical protein
LVICKQIFSYVLISAIAISGCAGSAGLKKMLLELQQDNNCACKAVGDLNQDRRQDIVYADKSGGIYLMENLGNDNFGDPLKVCKVKNMPTYIAVSDIDTDGLADIVIQNAKGTYWMKNLGDKKFKLQAE